MIPEIHTQETPQWLVTLTPDTMVGLPVPLKEILENSLYYPGSGLDSKPIDLFAGNVHSFVYSDMGETRDRFFQWAHPESLAQVDQIHGWRFIGGTRIALPALYRAPKPWISLLRERYISELIMPYELAEPFAEWCVFESTKDNPSNKWATRISILYICDEASLVYEALYRAHEKTPKILFLNMFKNGYGPVNGWCTPAQPSTQVVDPFYRHVVGGSTSNLPELIAWENMYEEPNWPGWDNVLATIPTSDCMPEIRLLSRAND